jgi:ribosome biogenesis GTPase
MTGAHIDNIAAGRYASDSRSGESRTNNPEASRAIACGQIVKLDRGLPLVEILSEEGGAEASTPNTEYFHASGHLAAGTRLRCEHATEIIKNKDKRAVIGDIVKVALPAGHDVGQIIEIADRRSQFVRKDPVDRARAQVLAANFDRVIIVSPLTSLNLERLQRELVLAHQTGADVAVALTKDDLTTDAKDVAAKVAAICGKNVDVVLTSSKDNSAKEAIAHLVPQGMLAILVGKSGAGKSTLINEVCGQTVALTGGVRETDDKGRHTTVAREIIEIPGGGRIVDMPGVRGLGLWDGRDGIDVAFKDITELAQDCKFRDCTHTSEPGCAVAAAIERGALSKERLASYHALLDELARTDEKREDARRAKNKKAAKKERRR